MHRLYFPNVQQLHRWYLSTHLYKKEPSPFCQASIYQPEHLMTQSCFGRGRQGRPPAPHPTFPAVSKIHDSCVIMTRGRKRGQLEVTSPWRFGLPLQKFARRKVIGPNESEVTTRRPSELSLPLLLFSNVSFNCSRLVLILLWYSRRWVNAAGSGLPGSSCCWQWIDCWHFGGSGLVTLFEQTDKMVYTLVVHLYAKEDKESQDKLVKKLQEASQVYTNDKETLGWWVLLFSSLSVSEDCGTGRWAASDSCLGDSFLLRVVNRIASLCPLDLFGTCCKSWTTCWLFKVRYERLQGPPRLHHRREIRQRERKYNHIPKLPIPMTYQVSNN